MFPSFDEYLTESLTPMHQVIKQNKFKLGGTHGDNKVYRKGEYKNYHILSHNTKTGDWTHHKNEGGESKLIKSGNGHDSLSSHLNNHEKL